MTRRAKKTACNKLRRIVDRIEATPASKRHELLRLAVLASGQLARITR